MFSNYCSIETICTKCPQLFIKFHTRNSLFPLFSKPYLKMLIVRIATDTLFICNQCYWFFHTRPYWLFITCRTHSNVFVFSDVFLGLLTHSCPYCFVRTRLEYISSLKPLAYAFDDASICRATIMEFLPFQGLLVYEALHRFFSFHFWRCSKCRIPTIKGLLRQEQSIWEVRCGSNLHGWIPLVMLQEV